MTLFDKEFQEELFFYLTTKEGFLKFGLLLPNNIFSLEYLDIAWKEVKSFYYQYSTTPTAGELFELINKSDLPDKLKSVIIDKIKGIFSNIESISIPFIEDKLTNYIKAIKTEKELSEFLDSLSYSNKVELTNLIKRLYSIEEFNLPKKEDYFSNIEERIKKYKDGGIKNEIDIGLETIAVGRGEIGVVLAPPKRGKSLFLVSAGYGAMLSGYKVLHLTLELRKHNVELRYDRAISGLTKSKLASVDDIQRIKDLFSKIKQLGGGVDIVEQYAGKTSIDTIYGLVNRELKSGRPYDLVIVDYADLLIPSRQFKERRFELSLIYTELRALGEEFNLAVWTASQTRRDTFNSPTIDMDGVSEDIGKVAICDLIVTFCQTSEEKSSKPELGRLFVAGAREKEGGFIIPCVIDRDISRILIKKDGV